MATLPIEGHWTLRPLTEADRSETLEFLEREPLLNVYLISRVLEEGLFDGHTVGVKQSGQLVGVASLTSNLVMALEPRLSERSRAAVLALIADRIITRSIPVRAMISDEALVDGIWKLLQRRFDPPTVVRLRQPVYALEEGRETLPDLSRVRYANPGDLNALVPACAAMHREEVGIDPLERDALGYRERVRELIEKKRALILVENSRIVFKAELSAVSRSAVQLMGVWTAPGFRRRGFARAGMREICGHLLRRAGAVTLFVNDFNTPAITLYEALGFRRIGCNRALIW